MNANVYKSVSKSYERGLTTGNRALSSIQVLKVSGRPKSKDVIARSRESSKANAIDPTTRARILKDIGNIPLSFTLMNVPQGKLSARKRIGKKRGEKLELQKMRYAHRVIETTSVMRPISATDMSTLTSLRDNFKSMYHDVQTLRQPLMSRSLGGGCGGGG